MNTVIFLSKLYALLGLIFIFSLSGYYFLKMYRKGYGLKVGGLFSLEKTRYTKSSNSNLKDRQVLLLFGVCGVVMAFLTLSGIFLKWI
jgi:hypothetical protein